jgi:hypothetical protein
MMGRTCPVCQRINPQDARFCHFDGAVLAAEAAAPGPGQFDPGPLETLPIACVVPESTATPAVAPVPETAAEAALAEPAPCQRPSSRRLVAAQRIAAALLLTIAAGLAGQFLWRAPDGAPRGATQAASPKTAPRSSPLPARAGTDAPWANLANQPAAQKGNTADDAIARGVSYLKRYLRTHDLRPPPFDRGHALPAGTPPTLGDGDPGEDARYGERTLAVFTLLECGVPADDILIQETVARVRSKAHPHSIRSLAWSMQLLDRLGDKADEPLIRSRAMRLVAGQIAKGNWSQYCPPLHSDEEDALFAYLVLAKRGMSLTPQQQAQQAKTEALWDKLRQYNETFAAARHHASYDRPVRDGDVASIRFAVLGLSVARRHGLPVEPVLSRADHFLRRYQHGDGSWWAKEMVSPFPRCRADMTCVGLLGLAANHGLPPARPDAEPIDWKTNDPAVTRAIRFLDQSMSALPILPSRHFPYPFANNVVGAEAEDDLQFLWSLDQVASLYGIDSFGARPWPAWVEPLIIAAQQPDGGWHDRFDGPIDTCYALLLLRHAHGRERARPDTPRVPPAARKPDERAVPAQRHGEDDAGR